MNVEKQNEGVGRGAGTAHLAGIGAVFFLLLAGCATQPEAVREPVPAVRSEEPSLAPLLAYHQQLLRMSNQELARERSQLTAQPANPANHVKLAMVYGLPRGGGDVNRALALLEGVLKSSDPAAAAYSPLARLLVDQYQERQRSEAQMERLNQQVKDAQRRGDLLQEKLDALTDIERSLPARPKIQRPAASGSPK